MPGDVLTVFGRSMTVTHLRSKHGWAVCGAQPRDSDVRWSDEPNCLGCTTGVWLAPHSELAYLITTTSVKDIASMEDERMIEYILKEVT